MKKDLESRKAFLIFASQNQYNMKVITSPIGLCISKGDWEGSKWTLSGYPKADVIGHDYPHAYAFEEAVKKNFNCSGLEFDSESCEFYVYAKTKQRLVSLLSQIEKHYEKAKKMY